MNLDEIRIQSKKNQGAEEDGTRSQSISVFVWDNYCLLICVGTEIVSTRRDIASILLAILKSCYEPFSFAPLAQAISLIRPYLSGNPPNNIQVLRRVFSSKTGSNRTLVSCVS